MKYLNEYQDKEIIAGLVKKINNLKLIKRVKIMEVCGTHTMSIYKNGIKSLIPDKIELISGPGCPVCVTPETYINQAISLADRENIIITSFADLLRVPGKNSSLQKEKARGLNIQTVNSPLEAVDIAVKNPQKEVVFLAVGFETTIPAIALSIKKAKSDEIGNFYLLQSLKLMPPVLKELIFDREVEIDGFILPGHVSTVIGSDPFLFLSKYNKPGVIAGFEPVDIVKAIYHLCKMITVVQTGVKNLYKRFVKNKGNKQALEVIENIFRPTSSYWRGIGSVEESGLKLKDEYLRFSAEKEFKINKIQPVKDKNCICGEILKGKK